jgi:hypothetical protein
LDQWFGEEDYKQTTLFLKHFGLVSFVYFRSTKNINVLEDYPINILAQFGFNWPSGSEKKIKMLKFMNEDHDGCQSDGKQC